MKDVVHVNGQPTADRWMDRAAAWGMSLSIWLSLLGSAVALGQSGGEAPTPAETPEPAAAVTETQVWHEPPQPPSSASAWLPHSLLQSSGQVVEFSGDDLRLQQPEAAGSSSAGARNSDVMAIATNRIVWIEPAWTETNARQGMQAFRAGQYEDSIPLLLRAIQAGPPVWQQQWLSGHLALAAAEAERYPAALDLVGQLARSRPSTPLLALLPIHWTARPLGASAVAAARAQIDADEPAVRLVAASWMLGSATDRAAAERALHGLSIDSQHPWIARLADAVRWRRAPVPQIDPLAEGWLEKIDQLPIALQGGPLLCVADRLSAAGLSDRAAELYWAVALLHQRPGPLAAEAREALQVR